MNTLPLGLVARDPGTPSFTLLLCLKVLTEVDAKAGALHAAKPVVKAVMAGAKLSKTQAYQLDRAIKAIFHDLNRHVAPFTYWGYHPTDGSLGVWIDLGRLHAAEEDGHLVQVSDDRWRGIKAPYVLNVRGDGSLTLYHRRGRQEVWTIS